MTEDVSTPPGEDGARPIAVPRGLPFSPLQFLVRLDVQGLAGYHRPQSAVLFLQRLEGYQIRSSHAPIAVTPPVDRLLGDAMRSSHTSDAGPVLHFLEDLDDLILGIALTSAHGLRLLKRNSRRKPKTHGWSVYGEPVTWTCALT